MNLVDENANYAPGFFKGLRRRMSYIAVDTETTGLMWQLKDRPFIVSMTKEDGSNLFWRCNVDPFTREVEWSEKAITEIRAILEDENIAKVFHNASFDIHMLKTIGLEVKGKVIDTLVFAHLCNNSFMSYGLKPLCKKLFRMSTDDESGLKESVIAARRLARKQGWNLGPEVETDYWMAEPALAKKYACLDTDRTMKLLKWCLAEQERRPEIAALLTMEMKCTKALIKMEERGIKIDLKKAKELEKYYEDIIIQEEARKVAMGYGDLNTRSPKQMHKVFYEELKAEHVHVTAKNKEGKRQKKLTANNSALELWADNHPLARCIMTINAAKGELTKFIIPLQELADENDILHPNYRQCGAITGRLSCTNPNLQNISNVNTTKGGVDKLARALFIPREGYMLYFPDYSQLEVWAGGFASGDKVMCEYLSRGGDMHGAFNKQFFAHKADFKEKEGSYRKKIKALTFATIYSAGAKRLASMGFGLSFKDAKGFLKMFWTRYSGLANYRDELIEVIEYRKFIEDPFHRRYYIRPESSYKGLNTMIQGSSSGVMKRAIVGVDEYLEDYPGCNVLLNIHDELCIEVPLHIHSEELMLGIIKAMQGDFHKAFNMPRPFEVNMAITRTSWAEKEEML